MVVVVMVVVVVVVVMVVVVVKVVVVVGMVVVGMVAIVCKKTRTHTRTRKHPRAHTRMQALKHAARTKQYVGQADHPEVVGCHLIEGVGIAVLECATCADRGRVDPS